MPRYVTPSLTDGITKIFLLQFNWGESNMVDLAPHFKGIQQMLKIRGGLFQKSQEDVVVVRLTMV